MIIAIAIFIVILAAKLWYDKYQYSSGKTINHGREAAVVSLFLIGASYLAGWVSLPMWFFGFWILFDGLFNLLIGQKWGYIGSTAKLDILQHKYPILRWIKYIGFAISTALFVITST